MADRQLADEQICIIGLGYVGLPLAVEFGRKRPVVGFDIDQSRIDELRLGKDRTREIDSATLRSADHLNLTAEISEIADASIYIVTVPTPIDVTRRPDLGPLLSATRTVAVPLVWPKGGMGSLTAAPAGGPYVRKHRCYR